MEQTLRQDEKLFKDSIIVAISLTAIMWISKVIEMAFDVRLHRLGIYPRELDGLKGILLSPFVHSDYMHLLSNSIPFLILVTMLFYFYRTIALSVTVFSVLLTGFLVWLFASNSYHIGASGVVYTLASFTLFSGLFRKNNQSVILSFIILVLFSGLFVGITPIGVEEHVSWESHLSGLVIGLISAYLFRNSTQKSEAQYVPSWVYEEESSEYMFPRDLFEKTKVDRYIDLKKEELKKEEERQVKVYSLTYVGSSQSSLK